MTKEHLLEHLNAMGAVLGWAVVVVILAFLVGVAITFYKDNIK